MLSAQLYEYQQPRPPSGPLAVAAGLAYLATTDIAPVSIWMICAVVLALSWVHGRLAAR